MATKLIVVYNETEIDIALNDADIVVKKGKQSKFDKRPFCHVVVKEMQLAQEISIKCGFKILKSSKSTFGITLLADELTADETTGELNKHFENLKVMP